MSTTESYPKPLLDFLHADNEQQLFEKLDCLLTPTELYELNNRIKILQMLQQGMPQRAIAKELGVAIATVSRGARALKNIQTETTS